MKAKCRANDKNRKKQTIPKNKNIYHNKNEMKKNNR